MVLRPSRPIRDQPAPMTSTPAPSDSSPDSRLPPRWLIAVDIGNNGVKLAQLAWEHGGQLPASVRLLRMASGRSAFDEMASWLPDEPAEWCVASVNRPAETRLAGWVHTQRPGDDYRLLSNRMLPIAIHVDDPSAVGTDRLLAAMAAGELRRAGSPAIVIDAGSAITVDLVSAEGAFEGGAILPGFEMMATALAHQTDQLPLIRELESQQLPAVVGKSTVAAIRSGLFWGHVGAVRELVQRMAAQAETQPQVFVAGGDAAKLAGYLGPGTRVVANLVVWGLVLCHRHLQNR